MNITEETLTRMTIEQFDGLNVSELAMIRNQFPEHYHRLWTESINAAPDEVPPPRKG